MIDSQLLCNPGSICEDTQLKTNAYFLDLAREQAGLPSDSKLAQMLGVSRQFISKIRTESIPIPHNVCTSLGYLCKMEPGIIYAETRAARTRHPAAREFWEHIARTLAAGLVVVIAGVIALPGGAAAAGLVRRNAHELYIMSSLRRKRRAARRPLRHLETTLSCAAS